MRLEVARSFRRALDQKRYAQLIAGPKLTLRERQQRARAFRQPDPAGIHCAFCGNPKPTLDGPCPNDGPDWPHPKRST